MHAVRRLAYLTFEHMHQLSLRFHLERKTGGLTRVLERGRNGIETIVRMVILQLVPTILELALIVGVLLYQFDWRYVAVDPGHRRALHVVHLLRDRLAHRHPPPDERQRHRRQHQGDRLAAQLRDGEVFRRRGARGASATTARWSATRTRACKAYTSLAVLNAGQAVIFTIGLAAVMVMCALRHPRTAPTRSATS